MENPFKSSALWGLLLIATIAFVACKQPGPEKSSSESSVNPAITSFDGAAGMLIDQLRDQQAIPKHDQSAHSVRRIGGEYPSD